MQAVKTSDILAIGQYSDCGRKIENQDSFGVLVPDEPDLTHKGIVMVIADGVSGSDWGKTASECCVKSLLMDYYCTAESWSVKTSVEKVLLAANRWMYGQGGDKYKTMATTMSALIFKSATAHIFHIGDTRIYLLREGVLERLTQDHKIWISQEKNYLARAVGIDLSLEIDYRSLPVQEEDIFIFTTDGVHEYLNDEAMKQILLTGSNPSAGNESEQPYLNQAAERLAKTALQNGSPDNVTCQIIRIKRLPVLDENEVYRRLTSLPFPPALSAGMKIDGYQILREIHASKRCQVYLALDEETQEKIALKTPSENYQDDPAYLELFTHEEWVGNRLDHPHVLKVIKQKRKRHFLYSVSEYIEGQTLRQWMDDHPAPSLSEVRTLVEQIGKGLQAFHRLEMIHQDLKPENIMIDSQGTVKIIDFGSTKIAGIEELNTPIERIILLGTKHYTAPEYLLGFSGTTRSDIFSLGVITYELLTGKLPFGENYGTGAITRICYTSARQWNRDIPVWVDKTLEKALHITPEQRYSEISEFIYDLSHPNPKFLRPDKQPLIERNPIAFWRGLALILLVIDVILLIKLYGR